jgi:hypothetical protein
VLLMSISNPAARDTIPRRNFVQPGCPSRPRFTAVHGVLCAHGVSPFLVSALVLVVSGLMTGCPGPKFNPSPEISPKPTSTSTPTSTPTPTPTTPTPTPTPLPEAVIPYSHKEVARLFSGVEVHTKVESAAGDLAFNERKALDSYVLNLQVNVRVPKAAQTIEELSASDRSLSSVLPGLAEMLPTSKVSDFYYGLYQIKVESLSRELGRLEQLLSKHNFFDCNTILELINPHSSRKALLIQSDMDVNADGSDSDRTLSVDGSFANFQPYTSYRWPKRTDLPSEFLENWENKLKQAQAELTEKAGSPERKKVLKDQIEALEREIGDLKRYSFLVSKADPFVVLPGFMLRQTNHGFLPRLGDYVVVIYEGKLYPAILGDIGPSNKVGEASLRLATQLDPHANAYNRPASNLNVTYLLFPNTAEAQPGPPDLEKMRNRCQGLLDQIGGSPAQLWQWADILATPTPSPIPSPTASPSGSPSGSASPSPTAAPTISPTLSPTTTPSPTSTALSATPSLTVSPKSPTPRHHQGDPTSKGD